jgi:4-amino-4-deoxy-L-arabinose transferase-like glycosyltransferase
MSLATDVRPAPTPSPSTPAPSADPPRRRSVDPARAALVALLLGTGVLYLWGLGESGWANSFYSAAAQAGSESWKAFFFGSSDAANSITVDKTPLSLWPMALSVKLFGLSSWSLLVPQVLMGVGSVWLLTVTVRRTTGSAGAGLLAGLTLALTPVAVLMFRFNNPDALLTLLLVGAAAATLRAVEEKTKHPVRWLALAGTLVGLAFLTKMLQAFLVLPALGLVYLLVASAPLLKRFGHLLVGFGAMLLSAGWWVAIVSLWPASSRPYIGGSQGNSILELTLGYNGLGRLTGDEVGSVGGGTGGAGGSMWGSTGLGRLLNSENGGQIGWLLPTALVLLVAGLWFTRRAPRTDRTRAGLVLWGGWLLVTAATFSFMAGIFHAYYSVALAPAVAALVGIGAWLLWTRRGSLLAGFVSTTAVAMTSVLAFYLLGRTPDFLPWLRWAVLVVGLVAALLVAGLSLMPRRVAAAVAATALVVSLAGPAAYAVETAATPHTGSIPSAGPSGTSGFGGGPGGGQMPAGGPPGGGTQAGGPGGGAGGGAGSLLNGSEPSAELTTLLQTDSASYTWVAAAVGSNSAAGYQLASEEPVMAIGGFNGSDPSPTLEEFQDYVADGEIHYFIGGGGGFGGQMGGSEASSEIATWVAANFQAVTVDGTTLYDLTQPLTTGSTT